MRFDTQIGGVAKTSPTASINVGETAVFIGVYDGVNVSLYKNGKLVGSTAATGSLTYVNAADRGPVLGNYYNYTGTARSFVGDIYVASLWKRALSDAEIKSLSDNPWQIFAPIRTPIFVGVSAAVSIYRPSSDVTTTGWTGTPDNTDKYKNIDEVTASDTDYITSPTITGGENIIFGLTGSLPAGTWDVRYRANFVGASAQVKIHLLDGSSVSQGASSWQTVTSSYGDYTASVTTTGAATRVKIEVQ